MSRWKGIQATVLASVNPPSHITPGPDLQWTPLGTGKDTLRSEVEKLYWEGVKAELENIIRTIKAWEDPELSEVSVPEEDGLIHGFDTFVDNVCGDVRACAVRGSMLSSAKDSGSGSDR